MPIRPLFAGVATLAGAAAALALGSVQPAAADDAPRRLPAPAAAAARPAPGALQTAVFSGGCFWGVQGVFSHVKGVTRAVSGYSGGGAGTADYETVSSGLTGHAESVQVTYDPRQVSYGELLRVFFSVVLDPTQVGGQGPDRGSQYRSVVWSGDAAQQQEAQAYIRQLDASHAFARPIVTQVEPLHGFYRAEPYHQDFLARHPDNPYIRMWDAGKVAALRQIYPAMFKATPARSA